MYKISKWGAISSLCFTILAFIFVMPNFTEKLPKWFPSEKVNLGLDLRGGAHLLLNVDFENYVQDLYYSIADSLKKHARDEKIGYKNVSVLNDSIKFELRDQEQFKKVKNIIRGIDPNLSVTQNNGQITLLFNEYALNQLQDKVIDQSIEIIRMRVDSTGTKEPSIQRQGTGNILLQVPGEENPAELKRVLGQTAKLTFHLVDEKNTAHAASGGKIPTGARLVKFSDGENVLLIKKKIVVGGEDLNGAQVQFQEASPVIHFSFNNVGAKKFGEATTHNQGKRLAIILDDKILSAPVINNPILGGDGIISGNFTVESANELVLMLRAGALPAKLQIIEERTVGPSLGADSIEAGKAAALVGFLLVIIFMILSYGILGIFANITLSIALIYILALLSLLQATLTLPGIAGIILTIGMAVDANVLIYERIREEINNGASNAYAVKVGFESAFSTITDANITTLIAAFLLYSFGIGAIKGFAVTLTIGIIVSMYTALVLTKVMIDCWLRYRKPKVLGI